MDQADTLKPFRAIRGSFAPPGRARWQGNHRWAAERSCREGSAVRVRHNRFGVVVGERVIVAGFDDPFVRFRWRACREDAHALYRQSEMAEGVLNDLPVVDERDNAHFTGTFRTEQRVGFPGLLDEFTPLCRGNVVRLVLRYINNRDGVAGGRYLLEQ